MLDFLSNGGWVFALVIFIMIMIIIRMILSNPKYAIKEILKKPWLIFQLFASAAAETISMLDDFQDAVEEVKDIADDIKEEIKETKEAVEKVKDIL